VKGEEMIGHLGDKPDSIREFLTFGLWKDNPIKEKIMSKETEALVEKIDDMNTAVVIQFRDGQADLKTTLERLRKVFKVAGGVFLDPDQNLPLIPDFQYDKKEDRKLLRRGAINYSKMLTNFRKIKEGNNV
jgi:hypothetical protein